MGEGGVEHPEGALPKSTSVAEVGTTRVSVRSWVAAWWNADFDYAWMPAFLRRWRLLRPTKWAVSVWCSVFGAYVLLVHLFTRHDPDSAWRTGIVVVVAGSAFYAAVRWVIAPWPPAHRSLWFVFWAESALTVSILLGSGATSSVMAGSGLIVATGMYVTLLHSSRILVLHLLWAGITILATAIHHALIDPTPEYALLAAQVLILAVLITGVPLIQHIGLQFLKQDAEGSHRDPLTGLLNRRGLASESQRLFAAARSNDTAIVTVVTDLDGLKTLNDTHGHAHGDHVLRAVATRLAHAAPATALVARLGGDEFATIATIPIRDVDHVVASIHAAVHSPRDAVEVTASTGAWIRTGLVPVLDVSTAFSQELHLADLAMYEAKNSGGDRLVCHSSTAPTTPARHRKHGRH
ncbi:GGDEF domain-containing protein [Antrihabitans sp. YC3-6]|uniref:GGDEF domain-containing protein n=1 Tax=Antrihabitans stalagmiti TaxID=2799499 RepID=A0A934NX96_9NOCA|nr:GGDEF domain-containing protein [Antrihabitans stalagmiti]MBJ8342938.1 GGDEF domain-containing protein [Antrihabitans stalagmiti]